MRGQEFYEKYLDGSFISNELNDEGNQFTKYYFDFAKGKYIKDYIKTLAKNLPNEYYVKESWENYDKIAKVIEKRYHDFKTKKWWEFWK